MILCQFPLSPPWVCRNCGRDARVETQKAPVRACTSERKILVRTEAEQAACLAVCHACDEFDPIRLRCKKCGCVKNHENLLSERLKSGNCPLGKWPKAS